MWQWFWLEGQKLNSSENIWKKLDVNEICCMEWAQTTLKLQERETFSSTIVRESAAKFFFSSRGHESWSGIIKACNPLVCCGWCYTGLSATPLMGYLLLGYLASHWSVPVHTARPSGQWRMKYIPLSTGILLLRDNTHDTSILPSTHRWPMSGVTPQYICERLFHFI